MIALFGLLGGLWRMWFGGSFGNCPRFIKYIVLVCLCLGMYTLKGCFNHSDLSMWLSCVAICLFWAKGHGDYFVVNDTGNDEARIKWIDWCLRQTFGVDGYYNFAGNCTGMLLRYTAYAIPTAVFTSGWFVLSGFIVASTYGICGKLMPNKFYTKYAEFFSGFFIGILLYLCI